MENNTPISTEDLTQAIENDFGKDSAVSYQVIGKTWLKNSIHALTVGNGERKLLFCARPDGNPNTAPMLLGWLKALEQAASINKAVAGCNVRSLLTKCSITVIPCLNPDGRDISLNGVSDTNPYGERLKKLVPSGNFSGWAANARGIDLRQNFNSRWVECKLAERRKQKLFPSPSGFGGEYPESEFETAALCLYIKQERPHVFSTISEGDGEITGFYPTAEKMPETRRGAEVCAAITKITHRVADERDSYGSPEGWFCDLFGRSAFRISAPDTHAVNSICTMFSAVV